MNDKIRCNSKDAEFKREKLLEVTGTETLNEALSSQHANFLPLDSSRQCIVQPILSHTFREVERYHAEGAEKEATSIVNNAGPLDIGHTEKIRFVMEDKSERSENKQILTKLVKEETFTGPSTATGTPMLARIYEIPLPATSRPQLVILERQPGQQQTGHTSGNQLCYMYYPPNTVPASTEIEELTHHTQNVVDGFVKTTDCRFNQGDVTTACHDYHNQNFSPTQEIFQRAVQEKTQPDLTAECRGDCIDPTIEEFAKIQHSRSTANTTLHLKPQIMEEQSPSGCRSEVSRVTDGMDQYLHFPGDVESLHTTSEPYMHFDMQRPLNSVPEVKQVALQRITKHCSDSPSDINAHRLQRANSHSSDSPFRPISPQPAEVTPKTAFSSFHRDSPNRQTPVRTASAQLFQSKERPVLGGLVNSPRDTKRSDVVRNTSTSYLGGIDQKVIHRETVTVNSAVSKPQIWPVKLVTAERAGRRTTAIVKLSSGDGNTDISLQKALYSQVKQPCFTQSTIAQSTNKSPISMTVLSPRELNTQHYNLKSLSDISIEASIVHFVQERENEEVQDQNIPADTIQQSLMKAVHGKVQSEIVSPTRVFSPQELNVHLENQMACVGKLDKSLTLEVGENIEEAEKQEDCNADSMAYEVKTVREDAKIGRKITPVSRIDPKIVPISPPAPNMASVSPLDPSRIQAEKEQSRDEHVKNNLAVPVENAGKLVPKSNAPSRVKSEVNMTQKSNADFIEMKQTSRKTVEAKAQPKLQSCEGRVKVTTTSGTASAKATKSEMKITHKGFAKAQHAKRRRSSNGFSTSFLNNKKTKVDMKSPKTQSTEKTPESSLEPAQKKSEEMLNTSQELNNFLKSMHNLTGVKTITDVSKSKCDAGISDQKADNKPATDRSQVVSKTKTSRENKTKNFVKSLNQETKNIKSNNSKMVEGKATDMSEKKRSPNGSLKSKKSDSPSKPPEKENSKDAIKVEHRTSSDSNITATQKTTVASPDAQQTPRDSTKPTTGRATFISKSKGGKEVADRVKQAPPRVMVLPLKKRYYYPEGHGDQCCPRNAEPASTSTSLKSVEKSSTKPKLPEVKIPKSKGPLIISITPPNHGSESRKSVEKTKARRAHAENETKNRNFDIHKRDEHSMKPTHIAKGNKNPQATKKQKPLRPKIDQPSKDSTRKVLTDENKNFDVSKKQKPLNSKIGNKTKGSIRKAVRYDSDSDDSDLKCYLYELKNPDTPRGGAVKVVRVSSACDLHDSGVDADDESDTVRIVNLDGNKEESVKFVEKVRPIKFSKLTPRKAFSTKLERFKQDNKNAIEVTKSTPPSNAKSRVKDDGSDKKISDKVQKHASSKDRYPQENKKNLQKNSPRKTKAKTKKMCNVRIAKRGAPLVEIVKEDKLSDQITNQNRQIHAGKDQTPQSDQNVKTKRENEQRKTTEANETQSIKEENKLPSQNALHNVTKKSDRPKKNTPSEKAGWPFEGARPENISSGESDDENAKRTGKNGEEYLWLMGPCTRSIRQKLLHILCDNATQGQQKTNALEDNNGDGIVLSADSEKSGSNDCLSDKSDKNNNNSGDASPTEDNSFTECKTDGNTADDFGESDPEEQKILMAADTLLSIARGSGDTAESIETIVLSNEKCPEVRPVSGNKPAFVHAPADTRKDVSTHNMTSSDANEKWDMVSEAAISVEHNVPEDEKLVQEMERSTRATTEAYGGLLGHCIETSIRRPSLLVHERKTRGKPKKVTFAPFRTVRSVKLTSAPWDYVHFYIEPCKDPVKKAIVSPAYEDLDIKEQQRLDDLRRTKWVDPSDIMDLDLTDICDYETDFDRHYVDGPVSPEATNIDLLMEQTYETDSYDWCIEAKDFDNCTNPRGHDIGCKPVENRTAVGVQLVTESAQENDAVLAKHEVKTNVDELNYSRENDKNHVDQIVLANDTNVALESDASPTVTFKTFAFTKVLCSNIDDIMARSNHEESKLSTPANSLHKEEKGGTKMGVTTPKNSLQKGEKSQISKETDKQLKNYSKSKPAATKSDQNCPKISVDKKNRETPERQQPKITTETNRSRARHGNDEKPQNSTSLKDVANKNASGFGHGWKDKRPLDGRKSVLERSYYSNGKEDQWYGTQKSKKPEQSKPQHGTKGEKNEKSNNTKQDKGKSSRHEKERKHKNRKSSRERTKTPDLKVKKDGPKKATPKSEGNKETKKKATSDLRKVNRENSLDQSGIPDLKTHVTYKGPPVIASDTQRRATTPIKSAEDSKQTVDLLGSILSEMKHRELRIDETTRQIQVLKRQLVDEHAAPDNNPPSTQTNTTQSGAVGEKTCLVKPFFKHNAWEIAAGNEPVILMPPYPDYSTLKQNQSTNEISANRARHFTAPDYKNSCAQSGSYPVSATFWKNATNNPLMTQHAFGAPPQAYGVPRMTSASTNIADFRSGGAKYTSSRGACGTGLTFFGNRDKRTPISKLQFSTEKQYDPVSGKSECGYIQLASGNTLHYALHCGLKYIPVKEAILLFDSCQSTCNIPKTVLLKSYAIQLRPCMASLHQAKLLNNISPREPPAFKVGELLIQFDTIATNYDVMLNAVREAHKMTSDKNSMKCAYPQN